MPRRRNRIEKRQAWLYNVEVQNDRGVTKVFSPDLFPLDFDHEPSLDDIAREMTLETGLELSPEDFLADLDDGDRWMFKGWSAESDVFFNIDPDPANPKARKKNPRGPLFKHLAPKSSGPSEWYVYKMPEWKFLASFFLPDPPESGDVETKFLHRYGTMPNAIIFLDEDQIKIVYRDGEYIAIRKGGSRQVWQVPEKMQGSGSAIPTRKPNPWYLGRTHHDVNHVFWNKTDPTRETHGANYLQVHGPFTKKLALQEARLDRKRRGLPYMEFDKGMTRYKNPLGPIFQHFHKPAKGMRSWIVWPTWSGGGSLHVSLPARGPSDGEILTALSKAGALPPHSPSGVNWNQLIMKWRGSDHITVAWNDGYTTGPIVEMDRLT